MNNAPNEARTKLREAIEARTAVRTARDAAQASLVRAEQIVTAAEKEAARRKQAQETAERSHSDEIAKAIRKGDAADTTPPAAVTNALRALAEAESQLRAAKAAADALRGELAEAEGVADRAERAVSAAAAAVLIEDAAPLAGRLTATFAAFVNAHDELVGLSRFGVYCQGGGPSLPPEIMAAIAQANAMSEALSLIRPMRAGNAPDPTGIAAQRFRAFLSALCDNADTRLDEVSVPDAPPPQRLAINEEALLRDAARRARVQFRDRPSPAVSL